MANSIYLGGGIKSAFCGGNVKEIWQGVNKLWGGEVDPMPEGFERVDYLEAISNSSIYLHSNNTNKWFNDLSANDTFEIEASVLSSRNDYTSDIRFYGMIGGGHTYSISICAKKSGNMLICNSSGSGGGQSTNVSSYDGSLTNIKMVRRSDQYDELYVNDTKYVSSKRGYFWSGGGGIGYLFTLVSGYVGSRFKSIQIFDNSKTTLKHHLVSARRISDNAPAVVDLVTQEFKVANSSWFRAVKATEE